MKERSETRRGTEINVIQDGEQRGIRNMMEIIERSVIENCETGKRTKINVIHDREQ